MDLDIMFVDDSTFGKLAVEREMLIVGGATLPVAGVLHLIALKLHATRTPTREIEGKDFYDIVNLMRVHQIDPASAEFTEILDRYATASIRQRLLDEHARFSR